MRAQTVCFGEKVKSEASGVFVRASACCAYEWQGKDGVCISYVVAGEA